MKKRNLFKFLEAISNRSCVLYGAGPAARELMAEVRLNIRYVVDDNKDLWGETMFGVAVRDPVTLADEPPSERPLVIVGSTLVDQITAKLEKLGYRRGVDAILSPLVEERDDKSSPVRHPYLLVTSPSDNGGLFRVDPNSGEIEKLLGGNARGLIAVADGYWIAMEYSGILKLNENFEEIARIPYEENLNLHSLAYHPGRNAVYVSETRKDRIAEYDASSLTLRSHIGVGKTLDPQQAQHHVNDICIQGDTLYASMFSINGVHRQGVMKDGGVLRFDLATGSLEGEVLRGLSQPHSIHVSDGTMWICNSMERSLLEGDRPALDLLGYTRGLAQAEEYFFVGQSQMRRLSRFSKRFNNISLDCGINIWDSEMQTVRFIKLPIDNIYDIRVASDAASTTAPGHNA